MRTRALLTFVAVASLTGCGIAARVETRNEYQASTTAYKACLAANESAPQKCEARRLAMEADERRFNNIAASTTEGGSKAASVTVLSR
jgi:hypothetical protein